MQGISALNATFRSFGFVKRAVGGHQREGKNGLEEGKTGGKGTSLAEVLAKGSGIRDRKKQM